MDYGSKNHAVRLWHCAMANGDGAVERYCTYGALLRIVCACVIGSVCAHECERLVPVSGSEKI